MATLSLVQELAGQMISGVGIESADSAEAGIETGSPGRAPPHIDLPGGEPPADQSQYFENERTIADARLQGNEGNLVLSAEGP